MALQVLQLPKFLYVVFDIDGFFFYKMLYLKQNTVANAEFLVRVPLLLSRLALVEQIVIKFVDYFCIEMLLSY